MLATKFLFYIQWYTRVMITRSVSWPYHGLDDPEIVIYVPASPRDLYVIQCVQSVSEINPPFLRVLGEIFTGKKRPGCKANNSSPPPVELKNKWSYDPIIPPTHACISWTGTTLFSHYFTFVFLGRMPSQTIAPPHHTRSHTHMYIYIYE
jgi:hypothetical protein